VELEGGRLAVLGARPLVTRIGGDCGDLDLDPAGAVVTSSAAIAAAALAVAARLGARRSVLAGDVAQELG
jgi:hypothetical protein